jgi:hypothetical protein
LENWRQLEGTPVQQLLSRLTYANVMSTLAVFLVLGGGAAVAAQVLAPNSVGPKLLQQEAVTRAKIREGAVSSAKLADGSVTTGKLADGSVAGAKLAAAGVGTDRLADGAVTAVKIAPGAVGADKLANGSVTASKLDPAALLQGSHVVARIRSAGPTPWVNGSFLTLANPTYTQAAGEDDQYIAQIQVSFSAACVLRRSASATLLMDPRGNNTEQIAGAVSVEDGGSGQVTLIGQFRPSAIGDGMAHFEPGAPTPHTFLIRLDNNNCQDAGQHTVPGGVTLDSAAIDVVGIR